MLTFKEGRFGNHSYKLMVIKTFGLKPTEAFDGMRHFEKDFTSK